MPLSNQSEIYFSQNLDFVNEAWEYLQRLQFNHSYRAVSEHTILSRKDFFIVYHEYLWLLERLSHPKETRFYTPDFIPINGFLDAYFEFTDSNVRLFKVEYLPSKIGDMDWRILPLANNKQDLEEMISPEFDIQTLVHEVYSDLMKDETEKLIETLIDDLAKNEVAGVVNKEDVLLDEAESEVILERTNEGIIVHNVTALAHVLLPERPHQLVLTEFWSEHFDGVYFMLLDEEMILHLVENLNQLTYLNQFLGIRSEKRYSFSWVTEEFGETKVTYQNSVFRIKSANQIFENQVTERFLKLVS